EGSGVENDFADGQTSSFSGNLIGSATAVRSIDRNQQDATRNLDPRPISAIANQSTTPKSDFLAQVTSEDGNGTVTDAQGNPLSKSEYLSPIQNVSYHGAFDPNTAVSETWPANWTATYQNRLYLPVEMAGFEVKRDGSAFVLSWSTASETNNAGFDVQRSIDGGAFKTIGFREGAGTTEQARTYRFTDANVPFEASTIKYRLRQKDVDGTTELSSVRTVTLAPPEEADLLSPFPNPAPQQATIRYQLPEKAKVTLSVYNVLGQRVATLVNAEQSPGNKQRMLNTSTLGSGVYFVRMRTEGKVMTERLTVVK
ncbi:MAG: T9SS type A sorting domain-containing protein, partial [Salinibacter sp.]|uniref:T9SS type A sorting domain-containing protein n=1 Tax=Salinibacter sp. TaxID=2065818 RepID=UPI0035D4E1EA